MVTNHTNIKKIFKGYCLALVRLKIIDNDKFIKDEKTEKALEEIMDLFN